MGPSSSGGPPVGDEGVAQAAKTKITSHKQNHLLLLTKSN
jgi:hypothetical protein